MNINTKELKSKLDNFKTECRILLDNIDDKEKEIEGLQINNENLQKARLVVAEAGKYTQNFLKDYIESMVSAGLQAIFEDSYKFVIEFDIKRNRHEARLIIKIRDEEMSPKDEVGGGVLDIASFVLRIVLWSIENPKTNAVMILDEPFKFLHGRSEILSEFLKKLSNDLNLQLIIVSSLDDISQYADKIFTCKIEKGITKIDEIN